MTGADSDALLTAQVRAWLVILGASTLAGTVHVRWNARMRTTAGTAQPRTGRIDLNPRLPAMGAGEVERTLRHEAAHLLAHWRAGRRRIQTHGPEWRQACADLGIPGETVTHTLPLAPRRRQTARFFYQCPACGVAVRRVRRFKRPTACLHCCRKHNGGQFDFRFQFRSVPPPLPPAGT
ncbi:MAG: SprT-like domain-containing protein [Verrucomicrobiota bacterium]